MKQSFNHTLIVVLSLLAMLVSTFSSTTNAMAMALHYAPVTDINLSFASYAQKMQMHDANQVVTQNHADEVKACCQIIRCHNCFMTCSTSLFSALMPDFLNTFAVSSAWYRPLKIGDVLSFIQIFLRPPKA